MTGPLPAGWVSVAGVALPADQVADALRLLAERLVLADRPRRRGDGPPVTVAPLIEAARRLRLRADAQLEPVSLPAVLVPCEVFAAGHGVTPSTVRRWTGGGRIEGAVRIAGRWMVPVDAPRPNDRRTT